MVDDQEAVRAIASRVPRGAGCVVLAASDGPEALRLFRDRASETDAVLLDLSMPGMSGHQVLEELLLLDSDGPGYC